MTTFNFNLHTTIQIDASNETDAIAHIEKLINDSSKRIRL